MSELLFYRSEPPLPLYTCSIPTSPRYLHHQPDLDTDVALYGRREIATGWIRPWIVDLVQQAKTL